MKTKKDAKWVIKEIRKHLPIGGSHRPYHCDCSADMVYYLDKIEEKLNRRKK